MNILEKLDYLLKINGLNKHTFALQSGIPYTTIDGWYKKGWEKMQLSSLKKMSAFFKVSLEFWEDEVELAGLDNEFIDFLPYLSKADPTTLNNIRAILGMPIKNK